MSLRKTTQKHLPLFIVAFIFLSFFKPCSLTGQVPEAEYELADTSRAIQLLDEALELAKKREYDAANEKIKHSRTIYAGVFGEASAEVAGCDYRIGYYYYLQRDLDLGIEFLKRALTTQSKVLGANHEDITKTCNFIGAAYRRKGDFDQAFHFYHRAKEIWVNLAGTEIHKEVATSYDRFGLVFIGKNDYDLALQYLNKSLEIRWKIYGETTGYMAANTFFDIGRCYYFLGDYDRAIEWQQKALDHWKIRNEQEEIDAGYNNFEIAKSYRGKGDYDKAEDYYNRALAIFENYPNSILNFRSTYFASLGSISYHRGLYEKAITYQDTSIRILLDNFGSTVYDRVAYGFHQKGLNYLQLGDYAGAVKQLDESIEYTNFKTTDSLHTVNSFPRLIDALTAKGTVYRKWYQASGKMDHLLVSQASYEIFDKVVDYQRDKLTGSSKIVLSENVRAGYEGALSTARLLSLQGQQTDYLSAAFDLTEKSHSLALFETMQQTDALHHSGIPDSLIQQEHNLQVDIAFHEKQRRSLLNKGANETDEQVLSHSGSLFNLKRAYDDLKERFEDEYPDYYRLKYDVKTVDIRGIQKQLLNSDRALIEYFVGDSSIFIFTVLKDAFYVSEIKKDFPLEAWVGELLHGIYAPHIYGEDEARSAEKYVVAAHRIYQKVFAPVVQYLETVSDLIIIPDGVLGYIPFDVLLVEPPGAAQSFGSHHYLLNDYQVSYAYSATLLKEMQYRKHLKEPVKGILAFAPSFGPASSVKDMAFDPVRNIDVSDHRSLLGPLLYNDDEVLAIKDLVGADVFLDSLATEERFANLAGNYRILHLSTHGKANDKAGDYSFLAFYELEDSLENEWLYNRELYNLRLNADMVVLSACETGIGQLQRGEGIISLARGFSYAGAKSIITTLWSVNDLSMKRLMTSFYTYLDSGQSKNAALRQAKLDFIRNSGDIGVGPYFWAGIIPVGDMSPVALRSGGSSWWVYGLGGLAVLVFLFNYFRKK